MGRRKKKKKYMVHVFSGAFSSINEADAWSQADYSKEPDEPYCGFWEDIGYADINPDAQELISGDDRFEYLKGLLVDENSIEEIQMKSPIDHNMLLLVFTYPDMNEDFEVMGTCERVTYYGAFPFDFFK